MNFNSKKYPILYFASSVKNLRLLSIEKLPQLCCELREYLLEVINFSKGHLASGLGVIEITVALHYIYNTPFDNLIWDVGHQSYPHKILTGRRQKIKSIGQKNGLHSFPCREESEYDVFNVGHSSTSISAGLGMSIAALKEGKNRKTVCVIGDGAITAGMAFEAMNHAGVTKFNNLLVILNDNQMSISKNVGALCNHLQFLRTYNKKNIKKTNFFQEKLFDRNGKITNNCISFNSIFSNLGFKYLGPFDGHNIISIINVLKKIKHKTGAHLLHLITKKGKGYLPAELDPIKWHSIPFCNTLQKKSVFSYSDVFGSWLCEIAKLDKRLIAITPAMCEGSGMLKFSRLFPGQYFDVAISEQHAVTFAAGLAIGGYKPIISIYSTFLQRAYDQLIHDVALQKLSILFAVDRGGIVGKDGPTHQGMFDLAYLRCIPGIVIMTPSDENECRQMLYTGYMHEKGPSVVRYPKGNGTGVLFTPLNKLQLGKSLIKRVGKKIAILNFGTLLKDAIFSANDLDATLVDMRFVKPLDQDIILELTYNHKFFVTLEEGVIAGGAGSAVNEFIMFKKIFLPILNIGLPDVFIPQGTQEEIRHDYQLDKKGIHKRILSWLNQ